MNLLVVLGHPNPASFNHALAHAAADELRRLGHAVVFHDLAAEGFDPGLPAGEIPGGASLPDEIDRHCRELAEAEGLVVVHPNWWGMPPAVLKGWIDRVVRCGVAYEFAGGDGGEGVPVPLLTRLKAVAVFNTGNTPPERERRVFGDPLERIWRDCIIGLCSRAEFHRRYFTVVCESTESERRVWLDETRTAMRTFFGREGD